MTSNTHLGSEQPSERRFNVQLPDSYATYVNRWALVVGVSKYQHQTLNLKYADRDAEAFCQLLLSPNGGNFEPDRVVKLTNEMATTGNITRSLRSFLKKPAREDLVVIYFACHGSPDLDRPENVYLITHDTAPDDISGTALPMREIDLSLRENLLAERVIIFADTCHSAAIGGGIGRRSIADNTALVNRYLKEVSLTRGGIALLTSAEANEVSFEDARWGGGHGVFTHFLLEGMRGGADRNQNGFVTVGELFEYVRENVQRATDYKQHPSIGTNPFDRNLPLAITFSNQEKSESEPRQLPASMDSERGFHSNQSASEEIARVEKSPHANRKTAIVLAATATLGTLIFLISYSISQNSSTSPPDTPSTPSPTSQPIEIRALGTASTNELAGFQALLEGNLSNARSYFGYAYAKWPTYHNVDEIYNQLLTEAKVNEYNSATEPQKQEMLKQIYQQIVSKYSWGVPSDILSQMRNQL